MTEQNTSTNTIDRPNRMEDLETRSSKQNLIIALFTGFLILVLFGFLAITLLKGDDKTKQKTQETRANKIAVSPGKVDLTIPKPKPIIEQIPSEIIIPDEIIVEQAPEEIVIRPDTPQIVTLSEIQIPTETKEEPIDESYLRKLKGNSGFFSGNAAPSPIQAPEIPEISVKQVKAGKLKNRNFLISQGTKIQCTMENALDSTIPGFTSCIVARDVYSDNGNVILLDRGTKVSGQYQSSLQHGQARLYVQWNRAVTPEGITIELGSGGTGSLGRAGHTGYVNTHWWERFGNAILVSIVSDSLGYVSDSTNNDNFENTEDTINEIASIIAEAGVSIGPTIDINQGDNILIHVQQDLTFDNVYNLVYDENNPN